MEEYKIANSVTKEEYIVVSETTKEAASADNTEEPDREWVVRMNLNGES